MADDAGFPIMDGRRAAPAAAVSGWQAEQLINQRVDVAAERQIGAVGTVLASFMSGLAIGLCGILTTVLALLADFFVI